MSIFCQNFQRQIFIIVDKKPEKDMPHVVSIKCP